MRSRECREILVLPLSWVGTGIRIGSQRRAARRCVVSGGKRHEGEYVGNSLEDERARVERNMVRDNP